MQLIINRVENSRFEFQYNGGVLLSSDKNRLFTDGELCNFKTGTGANIVKEQNVRFSDVTVVDTFGGTGSFTFPNVQSLWVKLNELNFFIGTGGSGGSGGGGGSSTFFGLLDTPSFFGNNGKGFVINEAELKLEAIDLFNFDKLTQMTDVSINALIPNKIIGVEVVNGENKFTLVDKPADPPTFFSAVGGFDYSDLETKTTPLQFTGTELQLTNDTLGVSTFITEAPFGISNVWDDQINAFDFSQLSEGDEVFLRVDIDHTTSTASQESRMYLRFTDDIAGVFDIMIDGSFENKTAGVHNLTATTHFYVRDGWKNNPVVLYYFSDGNSSIVVNGWHPYIIRKGVNIIDIQVEASSDKQPQVVATQGQTNIAIPAADNIDIYIKRVYQIEDIDYVRTPTGATMTYPLDAGDIITVRTFTNN